MFSGWCRNAGSDRCDRVLPNHPCGVDSNGALALKEMPKRKLILVWDMVVTHAGGLSINIRGGFSV